MISHDRLLSLVKYDPDTGSFLRLRDGIRIGTITRYRGRLYVRMRIGARIYYAHRLAWFYVFGRWPKIIDHVNNDGTDNRLCNLRDCSHSDNHANSNGRSDNTTRFKGVSATKFGTFRASIKKQGKCFYLGSFKTAEEAHAAYLTKARELFGQFANAGLLLLFLTSAAFSTPCLTHSEARQHWPDAHLYWHTDARCWDNHAKAADHYDDRPKMKLVPPPVPEDVAGPGEPQSWLDRVSTHGPAAEIYYPILKPGDRLNDYPILIWPQPWLSPVSMLGWPQLIDIDRKPFVAWDKRIGP